MIIFANGFTIIEALARNAADVVQCDDSHQACWWGVMLLPNFAVSEIRPEAEEHNVLRLQHLLHVRWKVTLHGITNSR